MNYHLYTIAGLFHDIGKFGQRADVSLSESTMLDPQSKQLAGHICNTAKSGYFTHQHVVWSNHFLERFKEKFAGAGLMGSGENNLINLAVFHHKPSTREQGIITLADHWSSGIDRNSDRQLETNADHGRHKFRSIPLLSIFPQLHTPEHFEGISGNYGYRLQTFNRSNQIFPVHAEGINLKQDYARLWAEFSQEFESINCTNGASFITTAYHLLKKYLWYIPASTMDYPNSSLFEHSKITGAFAHCVASYHDAYPDSLLTKENHKVAIGEGHYPVLMVCGDISGIQSFIYGISNKSAMKSLKGRSFYVQLLAETLCAELSEDCGGSIVNQVYAAGGKFYMLLPHTPKVLVTIEKYENAIQKKLFEEFGGRINVYIGSIPFTMKAVGGTLHAFTPRFPDKEFGVGDLWQLLAETTAARKRRKYQRMLFDDFDRFFHASGFGGDVSVCSVTADEVPNDIIRQLQSDVGQETIQVSPKVYEQIILGGKLYQAQALLRLPPDLDGIKMGVRTNWQLKEKGEHYHSTIEYLDLCINEKPGATAEFSLGRQAGIGFRFFGGLSMAQRGGKNLSLEELCLFGSDSAEQEKLGVLRMDVDNLGNLFMKGFKSEDASFSSLATLSALLDQFFGGYLNTIRHQERYKDNVNIVYSGGDDVFAVGRWDSLVQFAIDVRNAFRRFVCGREDISLSAGIAIVNPKFPIAKAAELAGEAEALAKAHHFKANDVRASKNAFTLFGIQLNWEHEVPFVATCKDDLINWIGNEKCLSKGILMKMFAYWNLHRLNDISWRWQAAYTLSRHARGKSGLQKECLEILKTLLFTNNYRNQYTAVRFDAFIAACRWAELELKTKTK